MFPHSFSKAAPSTPPPIPLHPEETLNSRSPPGFDVAAFVDIGVHQDGLVHVSQLADTFVKDPAEVVKPGQKVRVTVTDVDLPRQRIALSMKAAPQLGAKSDGRAGPLGRPSGGGRATSAAPPPSPRPPQSLNNDWFSSALNKKR